MTVSPQITVVGCGVIGLSSAIRLREAGFDAHIIARDLPPFTTSDAAAAIWYIYEAYPLHRAIPWARATFHEFVRLAQAAPESGVSMIPATEMIAHTVEDPWWAEIAPRFERLSPDQLLPGFVDGFTVEVPLIEPAIYLPYLMERFQALGGRISQREIATLADLYADHPYIVHCSGVWARQVADDAGVYPLRGQVVRVSKTPGIETAFMDDTDPQWPVYILPRSTDIVLGGTLQKDDWTLHTRAENTDEILRRTNAIRPALREAEILSDAVGLRPGRKEVRLESERPDARTTIIHNYGHGGAGFTLSWGCADEVVAEVQRLRTEATG